MDPTTPSATSLDQLRDLIRSYRLSQAIYVATKLGIPDLLAERALDAEDIARETESHAPSLYRVLLALAGAGVLTKVGPRGFALTPVGAGLRRDVPGSMRAAVLLWLDESHWRPWGHLLHTARTGETAFRHVHGADIFEYLTAHPEIAAIFDSAMTGLSQVQAPLVAGTYDFSQISAVVDVGGGHGQLLRTILERHAHLRGILFDLPNVAQQARALLQAAGLGDRCEVIAGSFFDSVPAGADVYILRDIIHDWQDDHAVAILTNCRRALPPSGRVLLVERHLAADPREAMSVLHSDLEMLVNVGGQERTTPEYASLLERAGLRLARTIVLKPGMPHHLIEATAP